VPGSSLVACIRQAARSGCTRIPMVRLLVTDGPYLETKEHIGGFWILEAADPHGALAWARKGAVACQMPLEVCEFSE
jgi:hypothetical protein